MLTPPPATLAEQYWRHLRDTSWYRSQLADQIPRHWKLTRPLAHLVFGTVKATMHIAGGVAVGAYEGTRRGAPHLRRAGQSKWKRKHGHLVAGARSAHAAYCCGTVHRSLQDQKKHVATHVTKTRKKPRPRPRPVTKKPLPDMWVAPGNSLWDTAQTVQQRGRDIVSDRNSTASQVELALTEMTSEAPRGLNQMMDECAGLNVAFARGADGVVDYQRELATKLNIDPTILLAYTQIAELLDEVGTKFDQIIAQLLHAYGPLMDIARAGAMPSEEALRN